MPWDTHSAQWRAIAAEANRKGGRAYAKRYLAGLLREGGKAPAGSGPRKKKRADNRNR